MKFIIGSERLFSVYILKILWSTFAASSNIPQKKMFILNAKSPFISFK